MAVQRHQLHYECQSVTGSGHSHVNAETWAVAVTAETQRRLRVFEMACFHKLSGITKWEYRCHILYLSLSLHFNDHFSMWTWVSRFLGAKDSGSGGDNWCYKTCKVSYINTNFFSGRMPFLSSNHQCHITEGKRCQYLNKCWSFMGVTSKIWTCLLHAPWTQVWQPFPACNQEPQKVKWRTPEKRTLWCTASVYVMHYWGSYWFEHLRATWISVWPVLSQVFSAYLLYLVAFYCEFLIVFITAR